MENLLKTGFFGEFLLIKFLLIKWRHRSRTIVGIRKKERKRERERERLI